MANTPVRTTPEPVPIERKAKAETPCCATLSHCSQEMQGEVVSRSPKELAHEAFHQLTNRVQTIDIAWGQAES